MFIPFWGEAIANLWQLDRVVEDTANLVSDSDVRETNDFGMRRNIDR